MPEPGGFNIMSWMAEIISTLAIGIVSLFGFMYKNDRRRIRELDQDIRKLEETMASHMSHSITRPEVETIVINIKAEFKDDHRDILRVLEKFETSLSEDIKELRGIILSKYSGPERRK